MNGSINPSKVKVMKHRLRLSLGILAVAVLAGCSANLFKPGLVGSAACDPTKTDCPDIQTPDANTIRPKHRADMPQTVEGLVEGRSVAALDKTTNTEKQAALKVTDTGAERNLGKTIASLGDVSQQGFWLKTALVKTQSEGRVVWADNGNSVNLTLIPKEGEASSGSQISLAAMRALGIPLTALADLIVFAK